jgi:protein-tyrosine phosphatase
MRFRPLIDYNEIVPHLYIGNLNSPKYHFDAVVNCTTHLPRITTILDCCFYRIPIHDHPSNAEKLYDILCNTTVLKDIHNMVTNDNKRVLVHCHMGIQRSCAVVACYLIRYHNTTPEQAISYIRSKRSIAFFGGSNFINTITAFWNYNRRVIRV